MPLLTSFWSMISFRGSPSHWTSQLFSDCPNAHFFWFPPPISPLFKRPEFRREAEPAFSTSFNFFFVCVCVFFFYRSQLTGKKSKAVDISYAKQKYYGQIIHQHSFSCPWFSLTQAHGPYSKRISQTETTETANIFSSATSWNWDPREPHSWLVCQYIRCHNCYLYF